MPFQVRCAILLEYWAIYGTAGGGRAQFIKALDCLSKELGFSPEVMGNHWWILCTG